MTVQNQTNASGSVKQIRDYILALQQENYPDWLWVTGEPQTDIIDAVANFHYRREKIVELFNNMKELSGFYKLLDDTAYRTEIANVMGLSTTTRNTAIVFEGVPREITTDLDAFIFYYLDRFGEKYGYRRGRGSASTGKLTISYPVGVSGDVRLVLQNQSYLYVCSITIDGSGTNTSLIYSFGYGSKYNTKENTLKIRSVTGALTAGQILAFSHTDMINGSDYQSNRNFLTEIDNAISLFTGPHSRNALSQVISEETSVDKYLIKGVETGRRYLGSTNIYIKSNTREIWTSQKTVGTDNKILVPYQPSLLQSIYQTGTLIPATEYTVTYPAATNDWKYSVKQLVWIDFTGSTIIFPGNTVDLNLEVDIACQNIHTKLMSYYATYNETARDVLTFQAQPQDLDVEVQVSTYKAYSQSTLDTIFLTALGIYINSLVIESSLETDDLRFEIRKITYNGELVVDNITSLKIAKTGGTLADQNLTLSNGQYWNLKTLTIKVL